MTVLNPMMFQSTLMCLTAFFGLASDCCFSILVHVSHVLVGLSGRSICWFSMHPGFCLRSLFRVFIAFLILFSSSFPVFSSISSSWRLLKYFLAMEKRYLMRDLHRSQAVSSDPSIVISTLRHLRALLVCCRASLTFRLLPSTTCLLRRSALALTMEGYGMNPTPLMPSPSSVGSLGS